MKKLFLLLMLFIPLFVNAQIEHPKPQKVFDKDFFITEGILAGSLTSDGVTTVRGWNKGCEETGLLVHTGQTGRVIGQLSGEFVGMSIGNYFLKRGSLGKQQAWAWKIPSYILSTLHAGAAINNVRIGCG